MGGGDWILLLFLASPFILLFADTIDGILNDDDENSSVGVKNTNE